MITFIPSIKDTKTLLCDLAKWKEMTESPQTAEYISRFRKTKDIGLKQRLPAVNFHGYDPKVLKGLEGSRKQSAMQPSGLFMLDIDHVANPKLYWQQLKMKMPQEELDARLALVHITPSGEGLRIVMKGSQNGDIISDQQTLADLLEVKHDACTKDLSRWSFVPTKKDILYINPEILFADAQETTYNSTSLSQPQGVSGNEATAPKGISADMEDVPDSSGKSFPDTYRGIPYEKIVEALVQYHGGTPEIGERHARIITLANDLRYITDSNADWLMQIVPNFDKPDYEKRSAVTWAIQHNSLRKTKALSAVLDWLQSGTPLKSEEGDTLPRSGELEGAEEERRQEALASMPQIPEKLPNLITLLTSKVMDFQRPAVAQMVFPSLAAHVADSIFINNENKRFELSLMGVLVGKQSVGKGCIDAPTECIIDSILMEDEQAREELRAWAESQQNKKANEKGSNRPDKPIRILNTDTTPAALLANLYNAQHNGYAKNLCCFTKSEEIEEMYDMSPTSGRSKISQLIKKTYDRGRIGSERFTSSAANYTTVLRWNWITACTPDKAKTFFKRALTDGTLSRVDFATIIATDEDIRFVYGDYDEAFEQALEPYIQNLRNFRCEHDKKGRLVPFRLQQLVRIEEEMDDYIREYSKTMPDDTWRNYAWRTKLNCLKKILILFIANNGKWEDSFEQFCWWSFYYGMWVKMNLFYQQASEAFGSEDFLSEVSIKSPLEMLGDEFTQMEFIDVCKKGNFKSEPSTFLSNLKRRKKIVEVTIHHYRKITQVSQTSEP